MDTTNATTAPSAVLGPVPNFNKMKTVYAVTERGGRSFWTKIGIGFTNRDGSLNLRLDAVPVSGTMQVREYEPPERRADEDAAGLRDDRRAPDLPGGFS